MHPIRHLRSTRPGCVLGGLLDGGDLSGRGDLGLLDLVAHLRAELAELFSIARSTVYRAMERARTAAPSES